MDTPTRMGADATCPMMEMGADATCPMMEMGNGMMTVGMVLVALLTLAAISALVALTVFLVRRSHPLTPG